MKKMILIIALALAGCSNEAKQTNSAVNANASTSNAINIPKATAAEAKSFVADTDKLIDEVKKADLSDKSVAKDYATKSLALQDYAEIFGESVMDKPYGSCFALSIITNSLITQKTHVGKMDDLSLKEYKEHRQACLDSAKN